MTGMGAARFPALGTAAEVIVTDAAALERAQEVVRGHVREIDRTCSRFREDSEISRLHAGAGRAVRVSPLLAEALGVALRAAELTGGLVDPTVAHAVRHLGYTGDFAGLDHDDPRPATAAGAAPGWWRVQLDTDRGEVVLPRGVSLDLGATAKALAADRAAADAAERTGCGVFVGLGGDVAVAGPGPDGGWRIVVGDDHARADPRRDPVIAVVSGGVATSSTTCRAWRRAGRPVHHIVDPRTGDVPDALWRTVSVAAASCVDANTASTASIVLGHAAPGWLAGQRLPARLVTVDGDVTAVAGWPEEAKVAG
ncbi:FAD:protein FMN transferase [Amycolatopsis sp. K13G38]|uniref:FAD:protein FMN transferase n=1 Tax=Amycolatopsis acididurans TaxID=2724524 RepID=A0ABX1J853_9PSEU|nr:FAD:protein FMN transferase [Amycolatopsis acididurans]NKQ55983.1 FAD:protein FMN transferase [Amycolatopsis acididurans]